MFKTTTELPLQEKRCGCRIGRGISSLYVWADEEERTGLSPLKLKLVCWGRRLIQKTTPPSKSNPPLNSIIPDFKALVLDDSRLPLAHTQRRD
ncbi:hypothetical protein V1264_024659 [Littorina saxatilis]|uniref:Uncharacterized protein n=1 Tax=Littorina saxatilis TaxID=31220 RepID=A0AAN9AN64_9CAEN